MRPLVKFLLICSMPLASAGVVLGQEPPGARGKGIQDLRDQLEAVRRRSKDLVAGIDTIAAERQRINARVSETAKLIQQSETQLNRIEVQDRPTPDAGETTARSTGRTPRVHLGAARSNAKEWGETRRK